MFDSHFKAKKYFDKNVENYWKRSEAQVKNFSSMIFQRRIDIVENFLCRVRKGTVLDFGMGPAVFGSSCISQGLRYIGIDISPEMVQKAKSLNLQNAEFMVGDIDLLGVFRNKMDAVLCIGLLDYLEDPEQGILALADCVKPDGYLILSFRNRFSLPRYLRDVLKISLSVFHQCKLSWQKKAFFSEVHEKAFDYSTQLNPKLVHLGFRDFGVNYFNCSPFFFNFPLPSWIWRKWRCWDSQLASQRTRFLCSGGVIVAKRRQGDIP